MALSVTKVSEKVWMIDTQALGQTGTVAVYLVRGSKTALVDCGYASSYQNVLRGLVEIGVSPADVDFVIPTHVHLDHAGAAGSLLERMPRARVLAQERGVPHLEDPTRLIESATRVFGQAAIDSFGRPQAIQKDRIEAIGEESHVDLGGVSLTAVHAPGHAPHQISVLVEEEKLLLTADAVGIVYPSVGAMIPTTPPPSLNPSELWSTTKKLEAMGARALLVPHFGVRGDPLQVLETTREKTQAWIQRVKEMQRAGLSNDAMAESLRDEVLQESGLKVDDFPPSASLSIRVSLSGIVRYLAKSG